MKKKCMALMTVLVMVLFLGIPAKAENSSSETRNSVAVVYSSFDTTEGASIGWGWGSGFFVGKTDKDPEYLVTNHHVIGEYFKNGEGELFEKKIDNKVVKGRAIIKVFFNSKDYVEAYVVDYDASKDLVLLRLDEPTNRRRALKLCEPNDSMVGDPVYAVGYPGLAENIFKKATSNWSEKDASVTGGTVSRFLTTSGTGVRLLQTDAEIKHGNSGGPLVDKNGVAIGVSCEVVSSTAIKDTGLEIENVYYGINMQELTPMLRLHDVEFELVSRSMFGPILYFGIAVIAIIIVIAVIAVVLLRRKNRKQMASGRMNDRHPGEAEHPVPRVPVIRSLSPQHKGMRVSLKGRQAIIGRDRLTCAIAYSDDTAGVSEKHCSISWEEKTGDFILTDLKSTYGTFLQTGQKLEVGIAYRLKPGDSFYLGESKNMLRVEME